MRGELDITAQDFRDRREDELAASRPKPINLNPNEVKVLAALAGCYADDGFGYLSFRAIMRRCEMSDAKAVRRACRSLARKGLAQYGRGLWNDEGPAGSGYASTREGAERAERESVKAREPA